MNENELIEQISWQIDKNNKDRVPKKTLSEENFARKFRPALFQAFADLGFKRNGWKWSRFVDYATKTPEDYAYLYNRVLRLVLDLKNSYDDFFELGIEGGTCQFPNPLADLNRLESLFLEYFKTYYKIKNQLHYDLPRQNYAGSMIRGKIKWDETIKNSTSIFPLEFHSIVQRKEFTTPENILLILCAEWIYKESSRLLLEDYADPLSENQVTKLEKIISNAKSILTNFPLPNVLLHSKRYWGMNAKDARINNLISDTQNRIKKNEITNEGYADLLEWIIKFREQNIWLVNSQTPTQRPLKTRKNLDAMYEAWIFFEFANYCEKTGRLRDIVIQKGERKFEFAYNGYRMIFRWERKFFPPGEGDEEGSDDKHAWAAEAWPDFTVFLDDEIIGVFDAKNYSLDEGETSPINKILAYMTNLDTNLGVLFFPYKPMCWDDFDRSTKIKKSSIAIKKYSPNISENELNMMIRNITEKRWNDLGAREKIILGLYMPKPEFTRRHQRDPTKAMVENPNLTMSLVRFTPSPDPLWISMREEAIEFVLSELTKRISTKIVSKYLLE